MFSGHENASDGDNVPTGASKIAEDVATLFSNETFSDVTFLVGGEKLHGHKAILAVRNKYFGDLFKTNSEKKEITISNTSLEAYRILLKYIYTDTITIPSDIDLIIQVFLLAREYSAKKLTSIMSGQVESTLDIKNVCIFLNRANDENLVELQDVCHSFMDENAVEIISSDSFSDLTQKSLTQVMKRDTFASLGKEIYESIAKWCEKNDSLDYLVSDCIRRSLLTSREIVSIIWPKLVNSENSLETMSEIVGTRSKVGLPMVVFSIDENIATVQCGAKVISGVETNDFLLTGNTDVAKNVQHTIDGQNGIVISLSRPHCINHIRMRLYDADKRYYSYYIETSLDQEKWSRVVDYSKYACRSIQNLYFHQQACRYIKIVGTANSEGRDFQLVFFEAFNKNKIPKTISSVICPEVNVATLENNVIIVGRNYPQALIEKGNAYCQHRVGYDNVILQLSQPYVISSMKFLLEKPYSCKYRIETSVNKINWEILVDRTNVECTSWQDLHFAERVVVFIKIIGIWASSNRTWFSCNSFECPSESKK